MRIYIGDEHVAALYREEIGGDWITFPAGEEHKNRRTKEAIEDALFARGVGKDSTLIAVGGGATLDLVGFVAATYMRGLPLVLMPTTLLALCDASIGGKNGVNTPYGKNMIGTIYQPVKTIVDLRFLKTLSPEAMRSGFAEMIKHAMVADPDYFTYLEGEYDLAVAIKRSREIKEQIVKIDLHEEGLRRILNFGHTFAHALEQVTEYAITHGDAVALGLLFEGMLSENIALERLHRLLLRFGFPLKFDCSKEALFAMMERDKKNKRFVQLQGVGIPKVFDGEYCAPVEKKKIEEAFDALRHFERV